MSRRFIFTLLTLGLIIIAAVVAVFLAKGYTFSPTDKRIVGTGIISVTSTPDAASVFLDGHLTTATDATIPSLPPKEYTVRVVKEGFIPWEKRVEVKEGLVTDLKIRLFPAIPTIYPLTFTGVGGPVLSPDGEKLAYVVPVATASAGLNVSTRKKAGVWVWQLTSDQPIAFARGAQPHQIAESSNIDYSQAQLRWSSDSSSVLATIRGNNYLLEDNKLNTDPKDITPTLTPTLKSWDDDQKSVTAARVLNILDLNARKIASESAILKWSPDETKILFVTHNSSLATRQNEQRTTSNDETKLKFKVHDLETRQSYDIPDAKLHIWLPDSMHVILVEEGKVSIVDHDGTNKAVIYAGNFEDNFVFAWPDSSRLVLISSFPTPTASQPNLYGINLK